MSDPNRLDEFEPPAPDAADKTGRRAVATREDRRARRWIGGVGRWVVQRTLLGIAVILAVTFVIFLATHLLPTDPAQAILGRNATPTTLAALRKKLGLDKPVLDQYWTWLTGAAHADFGSSLTASGSVTSLLGSRIENSLFLLVITAIISLPLSILLGAMAAIRRDSWADRTGLATSLVVTSLPEFVIGLTLIIIFATTLLQILPAVALITPGQSPWSSPSSMVLPIATLVLVVVPYMYRQVRASMIDALESEYVSMARLNGVPGSLVWRKHALPNALIPMIQASALTLTYLLGGIVVVEYLFGYPGIGGLLVDSISTRDLPVIEGTVLVIATGTVVFNIAADLLTIYATPKLRTALAESKEVGVILDATDVNPATALSEARSELPSG